MVNTKKIAVIGAGTMGIQISQVAALNGFQVVLKSRNSASIRSGLKHIGENLQRCLEKKRITLDESKTALDRIIGTTSFSEIGKDVDIVIESIIENVDVKKKLFKKITKVCSSSAIISSNTSSLSITELASSVELPQRFIGLHFFNPATTIELVEIVKGRLTSPETCESIENFARNLKKTPIILNDSPGFLVNRMLIPAINEAIIILEAGTASKEDIDLSIKLGAKHPMGTLELADLIGLDVCLNLMESLFAQFNTAKYRPCPLLIKMVKMKHLGRKTKRGFYQY